MHSYQINRMDQMHPYQSLNVTMRDTRSAVGSFEGSVRFLKKIVPLSVHNIIHNRIDFDPKYFKKQNLQGIEFMTFVPKMKHHITTDIYWWCKGAADAIQNKYLREMYLYFKHPDSGELIEQYKYTFKYNEEDPMEPVPGEDLLGSMEKMFNVLRSFSSLKKLSADTVILMELSYFQEVTPSDYSPYNFTSIDTTNDLPLFAGHHFEDNSQITIANINTGYHAMKCVAAGELMNMGREDEEEEDQEEAMQPVQEKQLTPEVLLEEHQARGVQQREEPKTMAVPLEKEQTEDTDTHQISMELTPVMGSGAKDAEDSIMSISDDAEDPVDTALVPEMTENPAMNCQCGLKLSFTHTGEVACTSCHTLQHIVCSGYCVETKMPKPYICVSCGKAGKLPADYVSFGKPENRKTVLSLTRLVLWYCYKMRKFPMSIVDYIDKNFQKILIKQIRQNAGVTIADDSSVTINFVKFSQKMKMLFYNYAIPDSMALDDGTQDQME